MDLVNVNHKDMVAPPQYLIEPAAFRRLQVLVYDKTSGAVEARNSNTGLVETVEARSVDWLGGR